MKARNLTPGMEVSVGGIRIEYGRSFAIVVRTGHWVHRRGGGWTESKYAPLSVLVMQANSMRTEAEIRRWWRDIGRSLTDEQLADQTGLSAEVLTNVRSTWAEYEQIRDERAVAAAAKKAERDLFGQTMQARADALAVKLGVAVIWDGGSWFQIHEGMARILLGERE